MHNTEEFKKHASERMKIYWEENREEIIENRKEMYNDEERNRKLSEASKNYGKTMIIEIVYLNHIKEILLIKIIYWFDI